MLMVLGHNLFWEQKTGVRTPLWFVNIGCPCIAAFGFALFYFSFIFHECILDGFESGGCIIACGGGTVGWAREGWGRAVWIC